MRSLQWTTLENEVYSSLEAKSGYEYWYGGKDKDEAEMSRTVLAQQVSEMIGMMSQRIGGISGNMDDLDEVDDFEKT